MDTFSASQVINSSHDSVMILERYLSIFQFDQLLKNEKKA